MCRYQLESTRALEYSPGFWYQPNGCILTSVSGKLQFEICQALLDSSAHVWIPRLFKVRHMIFPPAKEICGYSSDEEEFPLPDSILRKLKTMWFHCTLKQISLNWKSDENTLNIQSFTMGENSVKKKNNQTEVNVREGDTKVITQLRPLGAFLLSKNFEILPQGRCLWARSPFKLIQSWKLKTFMYIETQHLLNVKTKILPFKEVGWIFQYLGSIVGFETVRSVI